MSIKRLSLLVVAAMIAALMLTALAAGPVIADIIPPPPEEKQKCNAGNGNGNEGCDPGNSAFQNKGGDECCYPAVPPNEGGSLPNPGGNNVPA